MIQFNVLVSVRKQHIKNNVSKMRMVKQVGEVAGKGKEGKFLPGSSSWSSD